MDQILYRGVRLVKSDQAVVSGFGELWIGNFGPIPEGWEVHHDDLYKVENGILTHSEEDRWNNV